MTALVKTKLAHKSEVSTLINCVRRLDFKTMLRTNQYLRTQEPRLLNHDVPFKKSASFNSLKGRIIRHSKQIGVQSK